MSSAADHITDHHKETSTMKRPTPAQLPPSPVLAWCQRNGYENIEDWARDSDYRLEEVWRNENGDQVDIYECAWHAMQAAGDPEPVRRVLLLAIPVYQMDPTDTAESVRDGIIEGLPEPWFDEDDGGDLWLDLVWRAEWANKADNDREIRDELSRLRNLTNGESK